MNTFIKKGVYIVNIITIAYIFIATIFSVSSTWKNYNHISKSSYSLEKEYNLFSERYKKIAAFILKNKLPHNITYFNMLGNLAYNLPTVKDCLFFKSDNIIDNKNNVSVKGININTINECCNNNCVRVTINEKEILKLILDKKSWKYGNVSTFPIKKTTLLLASIKFFIETYKWCLFITLIYFFIFYLLQTLFLFKKNRILVNASNFFMASSDKIQNELSDQLKKNDMLRDNVQYVFEITREYFACYIKQVLTDSVCIEEVQIKNTLFSIEKLINYQLIKKSLKITLDCASVKDTNTDKEIIFLVLLNLVYRAVHRSKMNAEIIIKLFYTGNITNLEISDTGYEYIQEPDNNMQIYQLPELILDKLCRKANIRIIEIRRDMINVINVEIANFEVNVDDHGDQTINKTVKIKLIPL